MLTVYNLSTSVWAIKGSCSVADYHQNHCSAHFKPNALHGSNWNHSPIIPLNQHGPLYWVLNTPDNPMQQASTNMHLSMACRTLHNTHSMFLVSIFRCIHLTQARMTVPLEGLACFLLALCTASLEDTWMRTIYSTPLTPSVQTTLSQGVPRSFPVRCPANASSHLADDSTEGKKISLLAIGLTLDVRPRSQTFAQWSHGNTHHLHHSTLTVALNCVNGPLTSLQPPYLVSMTLYRSGSEDIQHHRSSLPHLNIKDGSQKWYLFLHWNINIAFELCIHCLRLAHGNTYIYSQKPAKVCPSWLQDNQPINHPFNHGQTSMCIL